MESNLRCARILRRTPTPVRTRFVPRPIPRAFLRRERSRPAPIPTRHDTKTTRVKIGRLIPGRVLLQRRRIRVAIRLPAIPARRLHAPRMRVRPLRTVPRAPIAAPGRLAVVRPLGVPTEVAGVIPSEVVVLPHRTVPAGRSAGITETPTHLRIA